MCMQMMRRHEQGRDNRPARVLTRYTALERRRGARGLGGLGPASTKKRGCPVYSALYGMPAGQDLHGRLRSSEVEEPEGVHG